MSFTDGIWSHSGIKCPNCGGNDTEINLMEVLTSLPAQFKYRCKCGHHWTTSEYEPNIDFQDILPPQLIGKFPDKPIILPKNTSYGWICPVCGAGVSPYQDHCPCCSGKSLTPIWTCGDSVGICSLDTSNTVNTTDDGLSCDDENAIKNNIRKQDKNDRSK